MMWSLLFLVQSVPGASATPTDILRVEQRAQPVLDRYYAAVRRCGARPPFKPTIYVSAGDGIIHYDQPAGQLVLYTWPAVTGEIRALTEARATAEHADPRETYEAVFNELLVAHELSHWLQGFQPERHTVTGRFDNWFAEQNANRLMVAFWREDAASRSAADARLIAYVGDERPNPVPPPAGMSPETFFTENTMTIVRGGGYGWYQALMTRRALAERPAPSFCSLVKEWLPLSD